MMRRLALLLGLAALAGVAGCGNLNWPGEAWSYYYPQPTTESDKTLLSRRKIIHWGADPKARELGGYLEHWSVVLAGSRSPREYYTILDAMGARVLGHVSEEGMFYRFRGEGEMVKVGEYPILTTGLKVFFGWPVSENLTLDPIDVY